MIAEIECIEPEAKKCKTQSYRQAKKELKALPSIKALNLTNDQKFALSVTHYLNNTEGIRLHKCPKCWLVAGTINSCICAQLPPLQFSVSVRFLILIHYKEWFNAGDDAKILLNAAPDLTSVFVYGRAGDEEKLRAAVEAPNTNTLLLFPSDRSITVTEFLARRSTESKQETISSNNNASSSANSEEEANNSGSSEQESSDSNNNNNSENKVNVVEGSVRVRVRGDVVVGDVVVGESRSLESNESNESKANVESESGGSNSSSNSGEQKILNILVLDGTWTQVRSMKKYFERKIDTQSRVPEVALSPMSLEYWNNRGATSVYKRTQTQENRVCTIEAIALLLRELGETMQVCDELIRYVQVNNQAISPPSAPPQNTTPTH